MKFLSLLISFLIVVFSPLFVFAGTVSQGRTYGGPTESAYLQQLNFLLHSHQTEILAGCVNPENPEAIDLIASGELRGSAAEAYADMMLVKYLRAQETYPEALELNHDVKVGFMRIGRHIFHVVIDSKDGRGQCLYFTKFGQFVNRAQSDLYLNWSLQL